MDSGQYKKIISDLREHVEIEISQVGGYWPVSVAMANVVEELGYATDYLLASDHENCARHMGYALWVLTCVANQYCSDLSRCISAGWSNSAVEEADIERSLLRVFRHCGEILRVTNRYEHNIYSDDRENDPIGNLIVRAHSAIIRCIELLDGDLNSILEARTQLVRSFRGRPGIPERPRSDPTIGDSFLRFKNLSTITACPFAKSAKVWVTEPWGRGATAAEFVASTRNTFERFRRVSQPEGFDGIAIERFGVRDLKDLENDTHDLLNEIGRYSDPNPMSRPLEKKEWKFLIFGIDAFVTIFSSVYPKDHPRYSHSQGSTFYFFQPQASFKAKAAREKESIRKDFAAVGQDYRSVLKKVRFEAQKYIKPIDLENGEPVVWWKT